jgi:hypothetical protein
MTMVNRTGISASNAGACIGSLVVLLRGAVIQPVHIELVLAEIHPGCGWKNRCDMRSHIASELEDGRVD